MVIDTIKRAVTNPIQTANDARIYSLNAMGGRTNGIEGGLGWVWASLILFFLDLFAKDWHIESLFGFKGINFKSLINEVFSDYMWIIRVGFSSVVLIILVAYIIFGKHNKEEIFSFSLIVVFTAIILSLIGYFNFMPGIIHLLFAWFMMFGLFQKSMPKQDAHMLLAVMLFIDFFAFSLVATIPALAWFNRAIIPIYFFVSLNYTRPSWVKNWLIFAIVLFYLLQVTVANVEFRTAGERMGDDSKLSFIQSLGRVKEGITNIFTGVKQGYQQEKEETKKDLMGTSYVTEVDAKSKQDLGITIKSFEPFSSIYTEGDNVTITAQIIGRNIEDEDKIIVTGVCWGKSSLDSKPVMGKIGTSNSNMKDNFTMTISMYDPRSINCFFKNITKGSFTATINLTFNDTSQGYLTSYFIDRDRFITLKSQEIDVFTTFGIPVRVPISKSTNGPAKVGIVTVDPPILIPENPEDFSGYIGVSLTNNWFNGKILGLNSMEIIIPNGLALDCENLFTENGYDDITNDKKYILTSEEINNIKKYKIENVVSRTCSIKLTDRNAVLGQSPFVTKYFRSNINYNYLVKKDATVSVKSKPKDLSTTTTTTTVANTAIQTSTNVINPSTNTADTTSTPTTNSNIIAQEENTNLMIGGA